ncbi:MAG: DUF4339 domain-containing protein [Muribaculaceae bacterium]|nr:DUF4339 domain-containing protein [Muribaculaceae bacterium]
MQYMVAVNGQQLGPYTLDQLRAMAQQGQLTAATFVWAQGMPAWTPAGQVAELSILFAPPIPGGGATPPPMP